jgi:serine/threonine protein kinase
MRAITKLCTHQHPNIVEVFATEEEPGFPLRYHIDMEICDFDLETYLYHVREDKVGKILPHNDASSNRMKPSIEILMDIINGVVFIHERGEVHRDLKPRNSKLHSLFLN